MRRCDDLILGGWQIFQEDNGFRFGTDAVLLFNMITAPCGRTVDLCSGNGAVALMLLAANKAEEVTAVELQAEGCALAAESARHNGCSHRLKIHRGDICKISEILSKEQADTVCVNPPYFKKGGGILPTEQGVAISRHEVYCTVDDVLNAADYLLKKGGHFYMVHRTDRQKEIEEKIKKYNLFPREITAVFSKPEHPSKLFLLHAVKGVEQTCTHSDFTVMEADGTLSPAYKAIYSDT